MIVYISAGIMLLAIVLAVFVIKKLAPKSDLWNVPGPWNKIPLFSTMGLNGLRRYWKKIILPLFILWILVLIWAAIKLGT